MSESDLLSQDEIDSYWCNGYVIPAFRLTGSDIESLQCVTTKLVSSSPNAQGSSIRAPHLAKRDDSRNSAVLGEWLRITTHPKLLDIVEQLIGPDIVLWTSTLFYKHPMGVATPWHRDGCPFLRSTSKSTVTFWIAVFDVLQESAALRIIPKSHSCLPSDDSPAEHIFSAGNAYLNEAEVASAVNIELEAGQMVIFDVSTVHGSWPNLTSKLRAGYAIRFFPASNHFDRSSEAGAARGRELILVRGQDRARNISV